MIVDVRANPSEATKYRTSLDGIDVSDRCFYADDLAGVVRCYKVNESGHVYVDPDDPGHAASEELHGAVAIWPA